MKNYGTKDIMRMENIRDKSPGDFMTQIMNAHHMASIITEAGKAMARGYAAEEIFGKYSPMAAVFFERAHELGGDNVRPKASVLNWEQSDESINNEYSNIPENEQPASRRSDKKILSGKLIKKSTSSIIISLGRINVINGSGPQFDLYNYPYGIIEVYETENGKYRLIYTSHNEPLLAINEERNFLIDKKQEKWKMVDYIETKYVSNLAPLYGKSIPIYMYD